MEHRNRKVHGERRAVSFAGASRHHGSAVQLDQVLDDRETEAEAAVLARGRMVGLPEAVESMRQELGFDADPGIGDADLEMRVHALEQHLHPARPWA